MARAVFRRAQDLSDRLAQKASKEIDRDKVGKSDKSLFGRHYPVPHGPTLSPSEWIEVINGWKHVL